MSIRQQKELGYGITLISTESEPIEVAEGSEPVEPEPSKISIRISHEGQYFEFNVQAFNDFEQDAIKNWENSVRKQIKKYHKLIGKLTRREREVYCLTTQGHTNKEMAEILNISPRTVELHRSRVMDKLKCRTAIDLAIMAKVGLPA